MIFYFISFEKKKNQKKKKKRKKQVSQELDDEGAQILLSGHRQKQEDLAFEMEELTQQLKFNFEKMKEIISTDDTVLDEANQLTESNTIKMKQQRQRVADYSEKLKYSSYGVWFMILLVILLFIFTFVFIRIF